MLKEIVVNVGEEETRVAVLEDNVPVEIYIERSVNQRLVGNIFKGRVENVLPGMQAAFVNIGLEKNAFLYVEDAIPARSPEVNDQGGTALGGANICDILKQGQEVLVQIVKEPIGTKGPRVTIHVTLPGRYLVLMPTVDYIGISRRIESEKERERLKDLAARVKPEGMGVIVRTVAEGVEEEEFRQDINLLTKLWRKILSRAAYGPVPNLVHRDLELVQRILRDIFTEDVDRLTLNSRYEYEKVLDLLDITGPRLKLKVFFDERENIFEEYGIEQEIEKALKRKVWLKCGGYLVIDQAEALTAIDVNTGKYVGTINLEDTVLKTNLEAAQEIGRQLRLRNIGGIVIVDFIDMSEESHRQQVLQALEAEIKRDKTKTNILGITQLGLVEMTRKKCAPAWPRFSRKPAPIVKVKARCFLKRRCIHYKNQIYNMARQTSAQTILVEANPVVAARLIGSGGANLKDLENKTGKAFISEAHQPPYRVRNNPALQDNEGVQAHTFPVKPGEVLEVKVEEPHVSILMTA